MSTDTTTPVLIVGGGPTGICAALLLAVHGVASVVLERWPDIYPQPRAVHLDDEVYRILGKIGVAEDFAAISRPARGLQVIDGGQRVLARFERNPDSKTNGYPQANLFDQPELERILRNRVADFPAVTLRSGVEVVGLTPATRPDGPLSLAVRETGTGTITQLRGRYVLGCDGANSLVRRAIGSRMQDLGFEQRWLVVDVDTDTELGHWDGVHQIADRHRAGTYMRIGRTRHRWEFQLLPGEDSSQFATIEALGPLISPWTRGVTAGDLRLVRCADYTFRAQIADRWRCGPIFLLGDAAHLTPPFVGQGMGAGLRDAYNLTWKLANVIHRHGLTDADLDSYQRERKPHARAMIRNAILIGFAMTGGGLAGDIFRRLALPRVKHIPGFGRRVATSETPRLRPSTLIHARCLPVGLPGRLCPNALLDSGQRLDQAGTGYVVVTTARPDTADERYWAAFPATVLQVGTDSDLGRWLARGRATAVLVRPDGTVRAAAHRLGRLREIDDRA